MKGRELREQCQLVEKNGLPGNDRCWASASRVACVDAVILLLLGLFTGVRQGDWSNVEMIPPSLPSDTLFDYSQSSLGGLSVSALRCGLESRKDEAVVVILVSAYAG